MSRAAGQKIDRSGVIEPRSAAIRLRVVNESAADRRSMALASKELTEILGRAGVSLIWLTCTSGWADWLSTDPCQRERAPSEFWLRIVSRRPAGTSTRVLAFSELDETPGLRSAGVYYPAAVEAAGKNGLAAGTVLGAAIAHEVGHLVLGENAHSQEGLMSSDWRWPQFKRLSIGELSFTPREAKLLQDELRIRAMAPHGSRPRLAFGIPWADACQFFQYIGRGVPYNYGAARRTR